jgi:hypothetical protein
MRKLLLFKESYLPIAVIVRPANVVDAVHALQIGANAIQTIGQFGRDGVQINPAALLEIGKLSDFETIQENLPAHSPRPQGRRFPVVLLKTHIVSGKVQANCRQAIQIQILNIWRRGLKYHLKLVMLEQAIGIFAVPAVGGPTRRLNVGDAIRFGA